MDGEGISTRRPSHLLAYIILGLGVLSVSSASILFRLTASSGEAPLSVAFYRMAFTLVLLSGPLLWRRREALSSIAGKDLLLCTASGALLALHFASWFMSLNFTTIASSTVLVSLHPFMVLAFGYLVWNERVGIPALLGATTAIAGAALVGWGDWALGIEALIGDGLAVIGAATVGGYFLIGRTVRRRVDILAYSTVTYAVAAAFLAIGAVIAGQPLSGFPANDWLIFALLAVFPTIFGHTLFNWALRYLPASVVSVSILGEPVGASMLAWLIWQQLPGMLSLAGGVIILAGIGLFLVTTAERK
jgi:drug/metabolite transporter (DMT)-like permease